VKLLLLKVVFTAKVVQVLFIFGDGRQELGVGLFSSEELCHHLLHIGIASTCSNLLESLFKIMEFIHLFLHLLL
jgi:hypothetical protein